MQRKIVITSHISGQPISPIFKEKEIQKREQSTSEDK